MTLAASCHKRQQFCMVSLAGWLSRNTSLHMTLCGTIQCLFLSILSTNFINQVSTFLKMWFWSKSVPVLKASWFPLDVHLIWHESHFYLPLQVLGGKQIGLFPQKSNSLTGQHGCHHLWHLFFPLFLLCVFIHFPPPYSLPLFLPFHFHPSILPHPYL